MSSLDLTCRTDIGHREFDLKLTDRVNMKVPQAVMADSRWWACPRRRSRCAPTPLRAHGRWACKFLGRGFKVARVDEAESALAKSMREKKVHSIPSEPSFEAPRPA